MTLSDSIRTSWKTDALIVVATAALWVISFHANAWFASFAGQVPGISLIFLPAGIRLLCLLAGGVWAAVGIVLGALISMGLEFSAVPWWQALAIALTAGFAPYLSLLAAARLLGVGPRLINLATFHLPVIALVMGLGSALAHNLLFASLGLTLWVDFARNTLAMSAGDFVGSILAVLLVTGLARLWRRRLSAT